MEEKDGPLWERGKKLFYGEFGDTKGQKLKVFIIENLENAKTNASTSILIFKDKIPIITMKCQRGPRNLEHYREEECFPSIFSLPTGMSALYRQTIAALKQKERKMLIIVLRWLTCSASQITLEPIADELMSECTDQKQEEGVVDEIERSRLWGVFEQGSPDTYLTDLPLTAIYDLVKDLQEVGREFMKE
ncbi:hypothetical protein K432DRAFT_409415 [Lepidopterella palustris CBS 459.81]|uniref:Uncharacterized protein n=1 Tax=Lepidopterella palustris CBS 459.81 TaxID=1314670 RepID=A0A8E2E0A2_9PEZI|nr:hypothetical protein K432DRAFT_409415 [Lepidopterella palustris CBS 459.81]